MATVMITAVAGMLYLLSSNILSGRRIVEIVEDNAKQTNIKNFQTVNGEKAKERIFMLIGVFFGQGTCHVLF